MEGVGSNPPRRRCGYQINSYKKGKNLSKAKTTTRCNDGRRRTCKFIAHNTTSYTFHNTRQTRTIHQNLSCSSDNLIYMINCKRCLKTDTTLPSQYIGQTGHTLRESFGEHRQGIQNNTDESGPIHFRNSRDSYLYTMEQHFISTAGTLKNGINWTSDHYL